ncbi:uncharacterized protein LOC129802616 [Phlebotomus papatasi]|uniref:uncharacterized protein LOC129802616 n=1 Tax=Phlebotomus papatasi TaxID=29031 RepID=UPI002483C251|nr:uncharacterized protein LOC129802616 [Phlebotomus papatasi]
MELKKLGFFFAVVIHSLWRVEAAPACMIYLTLTPLARSTEERYLEINWGSECGEKMWIGIFQKDPSLFNEQPIYYMDTHNRPSGYEMTGIQLGHVDLPEEWQDSSGNKKNFRTQCLPYFVAGFSGDDLVALDCLKIQPQWQTQMKDLIGNTPLKELFIPGTHCSACYVNETQFRAPLLSQIVFTQDFNVWTQLVFGVRYLDVSVGYHQRDGLNERFWIVADNVLVSPIEKLLQDVQKFVQTTGEVVILDFGAFPLGFGIHSERHEEFREFLKRELKDVAFPRQKDSRESFDFTINEIQSTGKSLIVTYAEDVANSEILWKSWEKHSSADLMDSEIREYVRNLFGRRNMSGQESSDNGWIFYGVQSLDAYVGRYMKFLSSRERAASINRNLTIWLSGPWSLNANAVAVDYILSSCLLDIAINTNRHKAYKSSHLLHIDY